MKRVYKAEGNLLKFFFFLQIKIKNKSGQWEEKKTSFFFLKIRTLLLFHIIFLYIRRVIKKKLVGGKK